MSIQSINMASASRHALLRDAARARKERRGAARALARHHGRDLVAIIGRGGCAEAVADAEHLVEACATGEPDSRRIGRALAHLAAVLRQGRSTAPRHARAERHRARLAALHALASRVEAFDQLLDIVEPADKPAPRSADPAAGGASTASP